MDFLIEQGFVPFLRLRNEPIPLQLTAAEYVIGLGYFFDRQQQLVTLFEPNNLFVNEKGELKILYRGIKGLMPAEGFDAEPIIDQVKRLLLLLFTSARFDELRLNGLPFAKTKAKVGQKRIVARILEAPGFPELLTVMKNERKEREEEAATEEKKRQEQAQQQRATTGRFPLSFAGQKKWLYIAAASWVVSLIVAYMIGSSQSTVVENQETKPEFLEGMRQSSLQQFSEAAKEFAKLDFKQLSKTDQRIVLLAYLYSGQAPKAIALDPTFAETVATYYGQINKPEELAKIKSNHPSIRFEQAYANKNYEEVIKLQNQVILDQRRREIVVTAYLEQGQLTEAKKLVDHFKDPALNKLVTEYKPNNQNNPNNQNEK